MSNSAISDDEKRLAQAASNLLKLVSVSSYGVTVRIHGVACPPLAESITGYGRWVLQTTWNIAERKGMYPTYGDTDSIFLDNPSQEQVQALIDDVKKRLNLDLILDKHYAICVLPRAKKAYLGIMRDGTPDIKGLTAMKSSTPNFIQQVFRDFTKVLGQIGNMEQYLESKQKIITVVHEGMKKIREQQVNLEDLAYSVQLYYDPNEKTGNKRIMPQPYQCALQLIDAGEKLKRRDTVHFIKVKPFSYKGRTFTVKPVNYVKNLAEIDVESYIRNLSTSLKQVFEPMDIELEKNSKLTAWFGA